MSPFLVRRPIIEPYYNLSYNRLIVAGRIHCRGVNLYDPGFVPRRIPVFLVKVADYLTGVPGSVHGRSQDTPLL